MYVIVVCLLYLMVLIDCRTISKSITDEYEFENGYEVVTDLYSATGRYKLKHHRKAPRLRSAERDADATKFHETVKNVTSQYSPNAKVYDVKNVYTASQGSRAKTPEQSFKWRKYVDKFWHKLTKSSDKNVENQPYNDKKTKHKELEVNIENSKHMYSEKHPNLKRNRRKQTTQVPLPMENIETTSRLYYHKKDKTKSTITTDNTKTKPIDNLEEAVSAQSIEILQLKDLYSIDQYPTTPNNIYDSNDNFTPVNVEISTDPGLHYLETAQLEELLNSMKVKAKQVIADQNQAVGDIISNSVTETTYIAEFLLEPTKSTITNNDYNNFVTIADIEKMFYKNLASTSKSKYIYLDDMANITDTREVIPRSLTEDVATIAQSIEDILQKEVKKSLKKIKNKLSIHRSKASTKSVIGKHQTNSISKSSPVIHSKKPVGVKDNLKNTTSPIKFTNQIKEKPKYKYEMPNMHGAEPLTDDDYKLLRYYEQILSQVQDEKPKTVTRNDSPVKIKKRDLYRLTKRNPETISDLKLKEDVKQLYDDGVNMPDYDYNESFGNNPSSDSKDLKTTVSSERKTPYKSDSDQYGKTNMAELLDKISFKDFVDGYKHYLRFQEEQANEKFSNSVKYQAHKHHNVDDIGKYILEKIPQLPAARAKRFFDDTDIDDQELSTKSDDSWFKKHFYIFIESGPPRKYHTSQTVSLKYRTTDRTTEDKTPVKTEILIKDESENSFCDSTPNEPYETNSYSMSTEVNLDDLIKTLNEHENSANSNDGMTQSGHINTPDEDDIVTTETAKLLDKLYLIQKIFGGKKRRTVKSKQSIIQNNRMRRNVTKTGKEELLQNEFLTNDMDIAINNIHNKNIALHNENTNRQNNMVNVNVVPQPTSIVNIRENASKKSGLRNFLRKFHFRKKKKIKRQCQRHPRFKSPFDKLKKIFSISYGAHESHSGTEANVYDESTVPFSKSEQGANNDNALKHFKLLSPDAIRMQIPNITEDKPVANNAIIPPNIAVSEALAEKKSPIQFKPTKAYNRIFQTYDKSTIDDNSNINEDSTTIESDTADKVSVSEGLMNIKLKPYTPTNPTSFKVTIDMLGNHEIRSEIDKIQSNLLLFDVTSIVVPVFSGIDDRLVVMPQSQMSKQTGKVGGNFTTFSNTLPQIKYQRRDLLQLQDGSFDLTNNKDEPMMDYRDPNPNDNKAVTSSMNAEKAQLPLQSVTKKVYRPYFDYFNDFVLWNGDILNVDKITTPMWSKILHSVESNNYKNIQPPIVPFKLRDPNHYTDVLNKPSEDSIYRGRVNDDDKNAIETQPNLRLKYRQPDVNNDGFVVHGNDLSKMEEFIFNGVAKRFEFNKFGNNEDVDVLGEDYTMRSGNALANFTMNGYRRSNDIFDSSNILMDTTLMAYDDDVDSIFKDTESMKKSRNSVKVANAKVKSLFKHPTVVKNEHPKQYYTTLLPMSSTDFDNFLKQNALDVSLVTAPVPFPEPYVDTWRAKTKTTTIDDKKSVKCTTKANKLAHAKKEENVKSYSENRINRYFYLKPNTRYMARLRERRNNRVKRHRKNIYDGNHFLFQPHWMKGGRQKKYIRKFKKKMRLFDSKSDGNATKTPNPAAFLELATTTLRPKNGKLETDVTVSIIKLNDNKPLSHLDSLKPLLQPVQMSLELNDTKATTTYSYHNGLLYDKFYGTKTSTTQNPTTADEETARTEEFPSSYPYLMEEHEPHRVRISSHSYNLDILYNKPHKYDFDDTEANTYVTALDYNDITPVYEKEQPLDSPPKYSTNNSEPTSRYGRNKRYHKDNLTGDRKEVDINGNAASSNLISKDVDKNRRQKRLLKIISLIKSKLRKAEITAPTTLKNTLPTIEVTTQAFLTAPAHKMNETKEINSTTGKALYIEQAKKDNNTRQGFQDITSKKHKRNMSGTKVDKREVTHHTYTARNVAAIDVIVDLVKNSMRYGADCTERCPNKNEIKTSSTTPSYLQSLKSIEVHIALPYTSQNENKRSLDKSLTKVRKVFSARMSSPVDLEYQVQSYEANQDSHSTVPEKKTSNSCKMSTQGSLSPGMYLLLYKLDPKNGFELTPVNDHIYNITLDNNTNKAEVTTIANRGRVTLSKEYVAAINKQIMQLFSNSPSPILNRQIRDVKDKSKENCKIWIDWEAIKKYFGHDRVCSCKCEANKPMCRACAASDAVIGELTFELENIAKYMSDHCTEIQTFFWMNPSGGRKLRDIVRKIDSNLKDYYKRVKGKCQGRTCKTFSLYIDKRGSSEHKIMGNERMDREIINIFAKLADDLEKSTSTATCLNQRLIDKGYTLIHAFDKCLNTKLIYKRSSADTTPTSVNKTQYSLQDVYVHILCKPTVPPKPIKMSMSSSRNPMLAPLMDTSLLDIMEKNLQEVKRNSNKNEKTLKTIPKKQRRFKYFFRKKKTKPNIKRDLNSQVETPLISDSGGTFWHDYINRKTSESRIVRATRKHNPLPVVTDNLSKTSELITTSLYKSRINSTGTDNLIVVHTTSKLPQRLATRLEDVSSNLAQLMQSMETEEMIETKDNDAMYTTPIITNVTHHSTSKPKTYKKKKFKKTFKHRVSSKIYTKDNGNITSLPGMKSTAPITAQSSIIRVTIGSQDTQIAVTEKLEPSLDKDNENSFQEHRSMKSSTKQYFNDNFDVYTSSLNIMDTDKSMALLAERSTEKTLKEHRNSSKGIFSKIIESLKKGVSVSNDTYNEKKSRSNAAILFDSLMIDNKTNPMRLFINNSDAMNKIGQNRETMEYTNLLLAIIQFETNELIDEWLRRAVSQLNISSDESHNELKGRNKEITIFNEHPFGDDDIVKSVFDPPKAGDTSYGAFINSIAKKVGIHLGIAGVKDEKEAYDLTQRICDIQQTYSHISDLFYTLSAAEFENFIKNFSCYKYKIAKPYFLIEYPPKVKRWDWIRKRRSFNRKRGISHFETDNVVVGSNIFQKDSFEKFVLDPHGIYRVNKRDKRMVTDLKYLDHELKNVSPLKPAMDELYAMVGDTITMQCIQSRDRQLESTKYIWTTERSDMLEHDNIDVFGQTVTIHDLQARNVGSYVCSKNDELLKSFRLSVVSPPNYTVIFVPNYTTDHVCDKDDLKAIKMLGSEMSSELSCGDRCSVRVFEPFFLDDQVADKCHIQSTAVVTVSAHPMWDCSVQCRRDLQAAFALLCAKNVPVLVTIPVVLNRNGVNKTLIPNLSGGNTLVSRLLLKNGTHGGFSSSYAALSPGEVRVLLACPAGFYFLHEQKICAPCPSNTSSASGDNVCSVCPRDMVAKPGSSSCHRADVLLRRMSDGDVWFCCDRALGSIISRPGPGCHSTIHVKSGRRWSNRTKLAYKEKVFIGHVSVPVQHVSPSRVILSKFFKPFVTSSKASDSQETKFDIWKEKNNPPPLPPIDFDT